jgi:hypothetical protein
LRAGGGKRIGAQIVVEGIDAQRVGGVSAYAIIFVAIPGAGCGAWSI